MPQSARAASCSTYYQLLHQTQLIQLVFFWKKNIFCGRFANLFDVFSISCTRWVYTGSSKRIWEEDDSHHFLNRTCHWISGNTPPRFPFFVPPMWLYQDFWLSFITVFWFSFITSPWPCPPLFRRSPPPHPGTQVNTTRLWTLLVSLILINERCWFHNFILWLVQTCHFSLLLSLQITSILIVYWDVWYFRKQLSHTCCQCTRIARFRTWNFIDDLRQIRHQ